MPKTRTINQILNGRRLRNIPKSCDPDIEVLREEELSYRRRNCRRMERGYRQHYDKGHGSYGLHFLL